MRQAGRWLGRILLCLAIFVLILLSPVAYVEVMCRPDGTAKAYTPILPQQDRRAESRTLLTYPEWHIVHAYADYAETIRTRDPHDFDYLDAIGGFWSSDCALTQAAGAFGGVDWPTKQTIYTIGVSFTLELLLKAAYEDTLGRAATWVRGPERAPLDDLSARQAADYAAFLQQTPWYRWDFRKDRAALGAADSGSFRDRERDLALGLEYRTKAVYADLIASALQGLPPDALTMRSVMTTLPAVLPDDVTVIRQRPEGTEVETPRYRAFTYLAKTLAGQGAEFVEIAGNDEILVTVISDQPTMEGAIASLSRQGNPGFRHLVLLRVRDLAGFLRAQPGVEHIHDY